MDLVMILDHKKSSEYQDHQDPIYYMDHYHCIEVNSKLELSKSAFYIPYDFHQSKQDICLLNNIYCHNNLLCRKKDIYGFYHDDKFVEFDMDQQQVVKSNLLKLLMQQYTI